MTKRPPRFLLVVGEFVTVLRTVQRIPAFTVLYFANLPDHSREGING